MTSDLEAPVSVDDGQERERRDGLQSFETDWGHSPKLSSGGSVWSFFFLFLVPLTVEKPACDRHARRQEPCLVRDHTALISQPISTSFRWPEFFFFFLKHRRARGRFWILVVSSVVEDVSPS